MTGRNSFSKRHRVTERRCGRSALYWFMIVLSLLLLVPVRVSMTLEISSVGVVTRFGLETC